MSTIDELEKRLSERLLSEEALRPVTSGFSQYQTYLLTVLTSLLAFTFTDRIALGLALQNIKISLHLTDVQLGLLTGIAFSLFYSVLGFPIARWADRGNRVAVIASTAAMAGVMVALSGLATTFAVLIAIRIGVAVGEAGCLPAANSLIADNFSRALRPRATATYLSGGSVSVILGSLLGGWINQIYGWRVMFEVIGTITAALSIITWCTLTESRRRRETEYTLPGDATPTRNTVYCEPDPSLYSVLRTILNNRTFRHLLACFAIGSFFGNGIVMWQPTFFVRSYGLSTGELGTWFAGISGVGGLMGTYIGGFGASKWARNDEALQFRWMAALYVLVGLISTCVYLSRFKYLAFAFCGLCSVGTTSILGPLFASIQTLIPDRMRAVSISIVYLAVNLIGLGLGPLATGALAEVFSRWEGTDGLRYALLVLSPGYVFAAWELLQASKSVRRDIEMVERSATFHS